MENPINQHSLLELREREGRGIFADRPRRFKRLEPPSNIRNRLLQSTEWVYRFQKVKELKGHRGCVNTIQWSPNGSHLITGSDDCHVMIWSGTDYRQLEKVRTGHMRNIFAAHFVPDSNNRRFVSAGMDGEVRLVDLYGGSAAGANPHLELLERSDGMCYKIAFVPSSPSCFMVTQQDGSLRLFDLRAARGSVRSGRNSRSLLNFREPGTRGQECGTNSIAFDPLGQNHFILGCSDPFLRLYDLRKFDDGQSGDVLMKFSPAMLMEKHKARHRPFSPTYYASGVDFNARGEVVVTYSRDAVYTFDSKCALRHPVSSAGHPSIVHDEKFGDVCTAYIQKYSGSRNVRTFLKEVAFYGDDEYVCTGSDDGMIYMWHKLSGKLVQLMKSDQNVVNGIAPHPTLPILASCGIDSDGKIWEVGRMRSFDAEKSKKFHDDLDRQAAQEAEGRPSATREDEEEDEEGVTTVNVRQLMALLRAMRQRTDRRRAEAQERAAGETAEGEEASGEDEGIDIDMLRQILGGGNEEGKQSVRKKKQEAKEKRKSTKKQREEARRRGRRRRSKKSSIVEPFFFVEGEEEEESSAASAPTPAPATSSSASSSSSSENLLLAEAEAAKEQGNEAFRRGELEAALLAYQRALTTLSASTTSAAPFSENFNQRQHDLRVALLLNRAAVFGRLSRHDRVLEDCTMVLRMDTTNMKALYRRAAARLALHQLSDAFTDISRARELYPLNAEVIALYQQIEAEISKFRSQ